MPTAFDDDGLGLILKGYDLAPNAALETMIAIYTLDVAQTILDEHPEIVDKWLEKIHNEHLERIRSCEFEQDPVACFNVSSYDEFERHFQSWQDGGMIAIHLPKNRTVYLSKKPLFSVQVAEKPSIERHVCEKCLAVFGSIDELEKHYEKEHDAATPSPTERGKVYTIKTESDVDEYYSQNPIWW
ncbi:C2H2-type zinc finger [Candidatus Nitrososphaera evergladensis SR1]|uniref:C2H2-type zinc finger n=1 Tax=Candidatus Nitrososphaera evergladensis SR1 TaxID=1459636 RepID=A0A075N0I0_9ARCH|nr:hypothetical protein [Candidatus Nitrososphaera evergladensis]AIF84989.1 C2H2-type zinc finger [Candidatus Nitrososphaera evergladensis SR1]